jgi:hypothetical protein
MIDGLISMGEGLEVDGYDIGTVRLMGLEAFDFLVWVGSHWVLWASCRRGVS